MTAVRRWGAELAAGLGAALAALVVLGRFAGNVWGQLLLFNGDSQLMPMLARSFSRDEHLHWVFSSPLFFFTELPVYLVCHVLTPSVQWALITNAVVNVVIVYVLVRCLAARLGLSVRTGITASLAVTFLLLTCMLLESGASSRDEGIASFVMFTTYYVGVLHIGLALLVLLAPLRSLERRRNRVELAGAGLLVALGAASDPLLLLQVVAPLAAVVIALAARRLLPPRVVAWELITLGGGAAVAFLARATVLRQFIVSDVGSYLRGGDIELSLGKLGELFTDMAAGRQAFELVLVLVAMLAAVVVAMRTSARTDPGRAFVAWFAAMSGPIVLAMVVVASNVESRYLMPMTLFPFLSVLAASPRSISARRRRMLTGVVAGVLVVVGASAVSEVGSVRAMAASEPDGLQCLAHAAADHDAPAGVGYFWRSRALDVYGGPRVLQVLGTFEAYQWLTNVGAYRSYDFSFVVVDGPGMGEHVVTQLGRPTSATECGWFQVWFYAPGSPGYLRMNHAIDDSLD